jgi:uncharacterized protein with von Willebrand factor type A (vWA) domain
VPQWIRRSFDSQGMTQYPTGKHLRAIQDHMGGAVVLCLDVSGSMYPERLAQAVSGCERFIAEALDAFYQVEMLFWNQGVAQHTTLVRDKGQLLSFLQSARSQGGNDIVPTLLHAEKVLEGLVGDRVVAIFGDGDLGNVERARNESERLVAKNIRILTCGLGEASAQGLNTISTEISDTPRTAQADTIAQTIADMAAGLRRRSS